MDATSCSVANDMPAVNAVESPTLATTIVPSPSIAMPVAIPGATTEPIGLSCVSSDTPSERSSASATV